MTATTPAGRYNPDDPSLRYGTSVRHAALGSATSGIRLRRASVPVETIMLVAAAVLFPLGLVFVMLGWYGAAHNGHTYAQIDYLISGGLFGTGVSVAGGFMYFGYWLSRQLSESRRHNALTLQSLQRLEDLLEAGLERPGHLDHLDAPPGLDLRSGPSGPEAPTGNGASRPTGEAAGTPAGTPAGGRPRSRPARRAASGAAEPTAEPTAEVPAVGGPVLLATPKGNLLHRPSCPVVARRDDLRPVTPGTDGFGYCTMCEAAAVLA